MSSERTPACPKCPTQRPMLPYGSIWTCPHCGYEMTRATEPEQAAGFRSSVSMLWAFACTGCRNTVYLLSAATYCPQCGAPTLYGMKPTATFDILIRPRS